MTATISKKSRRLENLSKSSAALPSGVSAYVPNDGSNRVVLAKNSVMTFYAHNAVYSNGGPFGGQYLASGSIRLLEPASGQGGFFDGNGIWGVYCWALRIKRGMQPIWLLYNRTRQDEFTGYSSSTTMYNRSSPLVGGPVLSWSDWAYWAWEVSGGRGRLYHNGAQVGEATRSGYGSNRGGSIQCYAGTADFAVMAGSLRHGGPHARPTDPLMSV